MGISFGMPSLIETNHARECAALCRDLGLDFIELNTNFPQYLPQKLDGRELTEIAEEFGVIYSIHLDDNMNIADFNPYVAQGYWKTMVETIELAKQVKIPVLNMHMNRGAVYTLPDRKVYFFGVYREQYLKNIEDFRKICEDAVGDSEIRICIENTDGYTDFQQEAVERLLESPVFGLTLDIGHFYCAEYTDSALYQKHEKRLCHMHMHDAKDGKKDHLPLGKGVLDVEHFLNLANGHNATVVLETKTAAGLTESVQWLRKTHPELF